MRVDPPKAEIHPWVSASKTWSRNDVDFAGSVDEKIYFVVADSYSKCSEIVQMKLPEMIVSDNSAQFIHKNVRVSVIKKWNSSSYYRHLQTLNKWSSGTTRAYS